MWPGTGHWTDHLWIGADPTFIRERASHFGFAVHSNVDPLEPGESYTGEVTATLPEAK